MFMNALSSQPFQPIYEPGAQTEIKKVCSHIALARIQTKATMVRGEHFTQSVPLLLNL